jgi:hypothetical protein
MTAARVARSDAGEIHDTPASWGVACIVALAVALGMAVAVPAAQAVPRTFNGFVGGAAGVNSGGLFSQPRDVAVYTANTPGRGDDKILVVEALLNDSRVHRLDGDGNFERLWGKDTIRPGAPGNTGAGFEVCTSALTGAAGCQGGALGDAAGEMSHPTGIAVDQSTGDVYVMDRGNRRIQQFTLDGGFVRAWGWGVDTGANAFEICTESCQAGVPGPQPGQFGASSTTNSLAISPVSNTLFATDGVNGRVMEFELDGAFVGEWGSGLFASGYPRHIAIDADGIAYASDDDSATDDRVVRFDTDPPGNVDPLPASLLADGETAGLEIDPTTGDLLIARDRSGNGTALSVVQEIADPGAALPPGGPPNPAVTDTYAIADETDAAGGETVRNIGFDPATENVYVAITNLNATSTPSGKFTGCTAPGTNVCAGLAVLALTTGPLQAALDAPADVGATTASLSGTVDPGGGVARYQFQISSDGSNWRDAGSVGYVAGSSAVSVTAEVSGLEPATLYSARLLVTKQTGIAETESVTSAEDVFLTDAAPPSVTTLGSAQRTDTSVRLRGLVDPQGTPSTYRFEYGPAGGSFDIHVPIPNADAGDGNVAQLVTHDVAGLQPETAYHYRIVATNSIGTAVGQPVTFTTKATLEPPPPPPGRGYELVSPAQKVSGVGTGVWYNGPAAGGLSGFAAHEGDRFAVQGTFGAVLVDGKYAFANDWSLSRRTPQGWVNDPLMTRRAFGAQPIVFIQMAASKPDLSLMGWGGTTVKLFSELEGWTKEVAGGVLYLRDWSPGKWEAFGPLEETQGGGPGFTEAAAIAKDAPVAVASGQMQGLAGPTDPTLDLGDTVENVYLHEVPAGPSDTFPGTGTRSLVNVCTPGTQIPARVDMGGGVFKQGAQSCPAPAPGRSAAVISPGGAILGKARDSVISDDGRRVLFMSPNPGAAPPSCSGAGAGTTCPAQVYVRQAETGGPVTRWISRSEVADQDASLMSPAVFEGASADGDKVFFRSASPLTADDRNGEGQAPPPGGITTGSPNPTSWDLYMYDLPDSPGADPGTGDLVRISAGPNGDGDCNSPFAGDSEIGALRHVSDDGSRLYFTCAAPLDGVPLADDGTITSPGGSPSTSDQSNLYVYDANRPAAQRYRFVARLPRTSTLGACATTGVRVGVPLAPKNDADPDLSVFDRINCMRGLDDGSFVSFWTDGQLTDDDPNADSGDIYAYDADQDELVRVTAPQGGVGNAYPCAVGFSGVQCYGDGGVGVSAGETPLPKLGIARDPESGDLMAFFQSRSQLVPDDGDDAYDVYQWRDGELTLISTGVAGDLDAFFAGNDRTGLNVYLATRASLVTWQDEDAVLDVYTARTGGGIPEPPDTSEDCNALGDQCQGPGQAPGPRQIDTDGPGVGNPPSAGRLMLSVDAPSSEARRRAARTGKLTVTIRISRATTVRLTARARLAGRTRRVAGAARRIGKAGAGRVTLRLSKPARQRLRSGKALRVSIAARAAGARSVKTAVTLRRR